MNFAEGAQTVSSFKFAGRLLRRCVRPYRTLQIPWPRPARHPRGRPAHPAREAPGRATCPASEPCRARAKVGILPSKKNPVVLWGDNCPKFRRTCPAEPRQPADMEGTQLMSLTNYEAVSGFAGHWLHRAQVSLLTGEIGQIKLSHIRKKNPGAGPLYRERSW